VSENSAIEWTDATFNIVWGCQRVSPGCQACYAESLAKRFGFDVWGPAKTTERRTMSESYWAQPLRWNKRAEREGRRMRVFCSSMADVYEDHPTNNRERHRLWKLILATPMLDWLLLTKRPENITWMTPLAWLDAPPHNVWYGTSCENQEYADLRIPELLKVPATIRWLSCEPLLGPIELFGDIESPGPAVTVQGYSYDTDYGREWDAGLEVGIDWVIAGGESGVKARPMRGDWARSLRDQCQQLGVAYFFKQWGGRVAKSNGRILDGRTWSEFPTVEVPA
jgi:protein gp37